MAASMSKLALLAALAAMFCAPLYAHADDGGAPGMTAPMTVPASMSEAPKSENTALALSLGGTAASAALVIAGGQMNNGGMISAGLLSSLLTPSLGEWYSGKLVTAGMGIRAASAVVTVVGIAQSLKCLDAEGDCHTDASAPILLAGGLIGYAGGTIYDIATAPGEARRYNDRHGLTLTLAPTPLRTPSGQATMGVGLAGTF